MDRSEPVEQLVERAVVGDDVEDAVGAHDEAGPERDHHRQQQQRLAAALHAGDRVGDREADHQAREGGAQRQRERPQRSESHVELLEDAACGSESVQPN